MSSDEKSGPANAKPGMHGQRRHSGARWEASERAFLRRAGFEAEGWTLNVSRGGARLVVEDPVEVNQHYELTLGTGDDETSRPVSVVWIQDEADGQIIGVRFEDVPAQEAAPSPTDKDDKPPEK